MRDGLFQMGIDATADPEYIFSIAIAIPIKNRSGKIADRFSDQNRSAMKKPVLKDFHSLSDKSGSDFRTKSDQRFPDQNRIAIFMLKSISDFQFAIAIAIPIKNRSGKNGDRFSFQNRSAIFRSNPGPGFSNRPLPVPSTSQTPSPPAFGFCNIAKYDLTRSRRRTPNHSGPVPVFSRIMTSTIRGLGENWYNRACMGLRCTRIPTGVFGTGIPASPNGALCMIQVGCPGDHPQSPSIYGDLRQTVPFPWRWVYNNRQ
jgi:hypothetical protein